jgi:hypothetical protein
MSFYSIYDILVLTRLFCKIVSRTALNVDVKSSASGNLKSKSI